MYTFLDQCPKCHTPDVRVEFTFERGYVASRQDPGEGAGVVDLECCTCNERLDDDDAVAACLDAAAEEMDDARYPGL